MTNAFSAAFAYSVPPRVIIANPSGRSHWPSFSSSSQLAKLFLTFIILTTSAWAVQPICGVNCSPNPGAAGYNTTVLAMSQKQNGRGHNSPFAQPAAGSNVRLPGPGKGSLLKTIAGSQSYTYAIPIVSIPGRNGLDLSLTLYYSSRIWTVDWTNSTVTFNADRDFPSYGFRLGYGFLEYDSSNDEYVLVEADGTKRQLIKSGTNYVSNDSSFIQYTPSSTTLFYRNGERMIYQLFPGQTALYRPYRIEDTNGNYISVTYRTDTWAMGQEINTITDTVGHVITFGYDATTHELTSIAQGASVYATFSWNNTYALNYRFSLTVNNSPATGSTQNVLTGCTYANGTGYTFGYGDWGIVNQIRNLSSTAQLRSSVSYNFPTAASLLADSPGFTQQTVFDGVNTSTWSYATTITNHVVTSIVLTDPLANKTTTNYASTGLITSVTLAPAGQAVLRTITNLWSGANLTSTTTVLNDTGQQSEQIIHYDTNGNISTIFDFDYVQAAGHAQRITRNTYSTNAGLVAAHILDRLTQATISELSSDNIETIKSRIDYVYDEYALTAPGGTASQWDSSIGSARGNVTTVKRYDDPITPGGESDRHFHYDQLGNVIQADLDCCNQKSWTYDSTTNFSYPTVVTSGTGPQLTLTSTYYSDNGLPHTQQDANGQTTTFTYDSMFRLTNVNRPDNVNLSTSYDDSSALAGMTNTTPIDTGISSKGTVISDAGGRPVQQIASDINNTPVSIVDMTYDVLGRRISVSNPHASGITPTYTTTNYDALNRVTKIIPPDGNSTANNISYAYLGNAVTSTDPAGKQRIAYHDAFQRLVRVAEPGTGTPATATITITGSEVVVSGHVNYGFLNITVNGYTESIIYGLSLTTTTSIASALATAFNSDPQSPVKASSSGAVLTLTSLSVGSGVNYSFSTSSYPINTFFTTASFSATPASGAMTGSSDGTGSLALTQPAVTLYRYDALDRITRVDQGAQQRSYVYTGTGRLSSITTPEDGTVTYAYINGSSQPCSTDILKVCSKTDARGITNTYTYDALNRQLTTSYSDGTPTVTNAYDAGGAAVFAVGRLTSMADGTGSETYTYDKIGRITKIVKVISGTSYTTQYQYNSASSLKSFTYPSNDVVSESYDALGRLSQVTGGSTNYITVPSGGYNAASLLTQMTYGNGVQGTVGYNARLQLASVAYANGATNLLNLTYSYDQNVGGNIVNNNQIQGITDSRGNAFSTSYSYDPIGRLTQAQTLDLTAANTWKLSWNYDRYGNRTNQNLLGGTISVTAPQLAISSTSNRITTAGYAYDASGNMINDSLHSYTYDAENRLKTIDGTAATYSYDGNGRRVKKVIGATTTVYVYSGNEVAAEYTNGTLQTRYIYGDGQLIAVVAGGVTTYRHPDHLSTRVDTNSAGTAVRTYGNLPFGETWYETGTASKWKFTNYERDTESGLDYATFRYDSSRLGRFATPDPLRGNMDSPQSLNRYAYVQNDPINYTDPLGLVTLPMGFEGGGGGFDWIFWDCPGIEGAPCSIDTFMFCGFFPQICDPPSRPPRLPPNATTGGKPKSNQPIYCNPDVIEALKNIWSQTSNGTKGTEASFVLNGSPDDYSLKMSSFSNEQKKQTLTINKQGGADPTFALFHIHPAGGGMYPSTPDNNYENNGVGDTGNADKYGYQVYVASRDGLTMYDPKTKQTTKDPLRKNLDWTKPCDDKKKKK